MRIAPWFAAVSLVAGLTGAAPAKPVTDAAATAASDPISAAGLGNYLSARFAANRHDYAEAAQLYKASLADDPDNTELLAFAFFFSANAGRINDAAALAVRLAGKAPDDRAARLVLAVDAIKHGAFDTARKEIAQSAKGPFTSFTVTLIDGWAAAGAGDMAAAAADLKQLHAQHSADGLAFFNEAMLAELAGDKDGAESFYSQALTASGMTPRVVDAFGRFLERIGRPMDAKALYDKAAQMQGFSAVTGPGLARIAKGVVPDPLVASAADGAAEALFGIAASLNDDASRDVSILYLRLALYLNPRLDLASILLANRCEALGKLEDAIAVYKSVAPQSPFYHLAAVAVAEDISRLGQTADAIAVLQKLAAQYPGDIDAWTALGDSLRQAERYGEAVQAYDKAIASADPPAKRNWPLFYARAIAEQQANGWTKAEADLKQALILSPNEPAVLNYLGYSWVDQKRNIKEALTMLEKARSLSPQDGYIIDSVGWAYYRLGRYDDAADALEDAVQLVPGDPTINDHLGDVYWRIGRKLDAQFQWNHALAFGPEAGEKAEIEKKLKSVDP